MTQVTTRFAILNAFWFQACWWIAIVGLDKGILYVAGLLALHCCWSPSPKSDFSLGLSLLLVGGAFDLAVQQIGIITFTNSGQWLPPWLALLWISFACSVNYSLAWLDRLPLWLTAGLGAVSGCASYYAGMKLGAAEIDSVRLFALVYGAFWALLLSSIVCLRRKVSDSSAAS